MSSQAGVRLCGPRATSHRRGNRRLGSAAGHETSATPHPRWALRISPVAGRRARSPRDVHAPVKRAVSRRAQEYEQGSIRNGDLLDRESRGPLRSGWLLFVLSFFCFLILFLCQLFLSLVLTLLAALVSHDVSPLQVRGLVLA